MVALVAAFTVWMTLAVLGTVMEYEHRRRSLGREVKDLRRRYSLSFPLMVVPPETKTGSDRKAA